ncbi:hypothetical protein HOLleu_26667 [Holothuria leucospilota]|uniref:Thiaminase-2/PQQC domain-containing protein n=1 Tax=Holothuria leucospilota TaxID=206669 RepID=A0A9Q1H260_HOLLE|nr:hypothetical protein HOLleu_26667 [Holothuria leucospilota]
MSKLSDQLWDSTKELRQDVMKTTFIQGLKNGSLDPVKFGKYVVQDVVFCYQGQKNMETIAARSFGDLRDFMKKEILSLRQAYIEFLTYVAQSYDPIYFLVAFLPCMRLWPWIGEQLRQSESNFGVYQSWVNEYLTGDLFQSWEDFINKSSTIDRDIASKIYTESMKDELEFFSSVFPVKR